MFWRITAGRVEAGRSWGFEGVERMIGCFFRWEQVCSSDIRWGLLEPNKSPYFFKLDTYEWVRIATTEDVVAADNRNG